MHKFLRAIGFSDITKKDLEMILDEVITRPEIMKITKDSEGNEFAELSGSFAANAGITSVIRQIRFGVLIRKMTVFIWIITIRMCLVPVLRRMSRLM